MRRRVAGGAAADAVVEVEEVVALVDAPVHAHVVRAAHSWRPTVHDGRRVVVRHSRTCRCTSRTLLSYSVSGSFHRDCDVASRLQTRLVASWFSTRAESVQQPALDAPRIGQVERLVGGVAVLGDVEAAEVREALGVRALERLAAVDVAHRDRPRVAACCVISIWLPSDHLSFIGVVGDVEPDGQRVAVEDLLAQAQVVVDLNRCLWMCHQPCVDDALIRRRPRRRRRYVRGGRARPAARSRRGRAGTV